MPLLPDKGRHTWGQLHQKFGVNLLTLVASFAVSLCNTNGTAHFKNHKQLLEYHHLLSLRDIWWSKF
jgi:hypothetical protein